MASDPANPWNLTITVLTEVQYPLSFQIALGVQLLVALALLAIRGWRSALIFIFLCPIIWLLGLVLASAHVAWGFEALRFVPIMWIVTSIVLRGRLTRRSSMDAPKHGAPLD